jgi:hypothetical protein
MNTLIIKAIIDLFENSGRIYKSGMVVDFQIRKDMFNSGKIEFLNNEYAKSGEINIFAQITFAYKDLVLPFIQQDVYYIFGEPSFEYGRCKILEVPHAGASLRLVP